MLQKSIHPVTYRIGLHLASAFCPIASSDNVLIKIDPHYKKPFRTKPSAHFCRAHQRIALAIRVSFLNGTSSAQTESPRCQTPPLSPPTSPFASTRMKMTGSVLNCSPFNLGSNCMNNCWQDKTPTGNLTPRSSICDDTASLASSAGTIESKDEEQSALPSFLNMIAGLGKFLKPKVYLIQIHVSFSSFVLLRMACFFYGMLRDFVICLCYAL